MALFLVTFLIMALAVAGMAVGVMFGRNPIAGSCGGLNAVDASGACTACSRPCRQRRKVMAKVRADRMRSAQSTREDGFGASTKSQVITRRDL